MLLCWTSFDSRPFFTFARAQGKRYKRIPAWYAASRNGSRVDRSVRVTSLRKWVEWMHQRGRALWKSTKKSRLATGQICRNSIGNSYTTKTVTDCLQATTYLCCLRLLLEGVITRSGPWAWRDGGVDVRSGTAFALNACATAGKDERW